MMTQHIKLLIDLPVGIEHGMKQGRVLKAEPVESPKCNRVYWWVEGDAGEPVGVLKREAVRVYIAFKEDADVENTEV